MSDWQVVQGDALDVLLGMDAESVQCVVTSPPYWGLRDYGTATWEGGDDRCDHKQTTARNDGGRANINGFHGSRSVDSDKGAMNFRDICAHCGAKRIDNQLGLERTPEEYVEKMVTVFREVWRVLRKDGTVWLNMGDCYANDGKSGGETGGKQAYLDDNNRRRVGRSKRLTGLKPKDLVGIPWHLAFALQADGWYLRSDIIWHKPNPMPESVTDRPTKSHEYVFLLTKSPHYFYDAEAVREDATYGRCGWHSVEGRMRHIGGNIDEAFKGDARWTGCDPSAGRNKRTVWTIPTEPFPEAHFATFPTKLVEPCVLAGTSAGDTVLDPFCGSGTVGVVALRLGRKFIGIELKPEYCEMARRRIEGDAPLFNAVSMEVAD